MTKTEKHRIKALISCKLFLKNANKRYYSLAMLSGLAIMSMLAFASPNAGTAPGWMMAGSFRCSSHVSFPPVAFREKLLLFRKSRVILLLFHIPSTKPRRRHEAIFNHKV
ncbi:MAG: hypothetical protein ACRENG_00670 [bacterium]